MIVLGYGYQRPVAEAFGDEAQPNNKLCMLQLKMCHHTRREAAAMANEEARTK